MTLKNNLSLTEWQIFFTRGENDEGLLCVVANGVECKADRKRKIVLPVVISDAKINQPCVASG